MNTIKTRSVYNNIKTPGVYIVESNSFPPGIVGVGTAVPAFIGYTATAAENGRSLLGVPTPVSSLADYLEKFGGAYERRHALRPCGQVKPADIVLAADVTLFGGGEPFTLVGEGGPAFCLYNSLRLFYANGGGPCWIVSCGTYAAEPGSPAVTADALMEGLDAVGRVAGPTMLVVPDATLLGGDDFNRVAVHMLAQCGSLQDRVAILDVHGADKIGDEATLRAAIDGFRAGLDAAPPESLRYGIAYFPFLRTSLVAAGEITIGRFAKGDDCKPLVDALKAAAAAAYPAREGTSDPRAAAALALIDRIGGAAASPDGMTDAELTAALLADLPGLGTLFEHAAAAESLLPPSGAMAGVFTTVDAQRGVWNAPANVGIADLVAPSFEVTSEQQEDLNRPLGGKAVNVIRTFPNRGPLVWGARTLDANSTDWRYVQVRRTMIYVEQSIKTALNAFVFAPNTATTWVTITSMIESFLHGLWAAGGVMGASPAEAYSVKCGLGSTMTPDDILNGYAIVHVVLQMVHPAEFIELVFSQQMHGGG